MAIMTEEMIVAAERVLRQMALNNQYITADTLIAVLMQDGYTTTNYSALCGVFLRGVRDGIIDKSPTANPSKSHSAKTVWRSLIYAHDYYNLLNIEEKPYKVLALIKRPGGATNWELSRVVIDYKEEVRNLRAAGYKIKTRRLKFGRLAGKTRLYTLRTK